MRSFLTALALCAALTAPLCADTRYFDDAALNAVQFVDANEGWAVGDEGVVWHTIDGGKNWERQPTGVRGSLRAVHFLNPFTGWAVGREALPNGGGSVGIVLVTRDGGLKWQRLSINALPGLNTVKFFNDKFGIAAGDGSEQYPSGVFNTNDGGRTWKPLAGPRCPSWLAADFHQDAQHGALAGSWSRLATLRQGNLGAADVEELGGRSVQGLQLLGKQAVAVGQGGLVLVSSSSAGVRWGFADLKLPAAVKACLDFQSVTSRGDHVWVVGRPGSVVMHSPDRGQSWTLHKTGQPLPLHGVYFLNEQRGWAVGQFGTVLATEDGGGTWSVQRQGGQRAALLFAHAARAALPLSSVALLGANDGYLTTALQVTAADPASAPPVRAMQTQRLAQAQRQVGGAAGEVLWQFPLPDHLKRAPKEELLAAWDRLHGGRAADHLLRQLVLALRVWQPDVVVTDAPASPVEELTLEAMQEAFRRAADPAAFPEQIEVLGLPPWKVSKLYARQEGETNAAITLDAQAFHDRLRGSAREFAGDAASVLLDGAVNLPTQARYRFVAGRVENAAKHRHFMEGIPLAEGGTARRTLHALPEVTAAEKKALNMRRDLRAMVEQPVNRLVGPDQLLAQIGPMLSKLPDDQSAAATYGIANTFARAGQWTLARETFLLMVERYPAHPLSADAYRWLVRQNCSSEARRRQEMGQFLLMQETTVREATGAGRSDPNLSKNLAETVTKGTSAGMQAAARSDARGEVVEHALRGLVDARLWYKGALDIEPRLAGFGPLFSADPSVQFCFQSARRNLGQFDAARKWYSRFVETQPPGPWREAAASELWLTNRGGQPPKPFTLCKQTSQKPLLDGVFDDDCWQGVPPLKFRNAVGKTLKEKAPGVVDEGAEQEYATEARLTYDREYLYLALRCQHPAERQVPPVKKRQRDADLRDFDRVSLLLDLDRDYSTAFHLQVDQRGCLSEDCWGGRQLEPALVRRRPQRADLLANRGSDSAGGTDRRRAQRRPGLGLQPGAHAAGPRRAGVVRAGRYRAAPRGHGPAAVHCGAAQAAPRRPARQHTADGQLKMQRPARRQATAPACRRVFVVIPGCPAGQAKRLPCRS